MKVVFNPFTNKLEMIPNVGGSNKQIQFNDNSVLGGAELYYDKVNQRLGIGTSPVYELDVKGSINLTDKIYYKSNAFLDGDPDLETFLIANKNLPFSNLLSTDKSLVIGGSGSSLSDLYSTIIIGSNSASVLTASTDNIIIGVDSYPNGNSTGNILIGNRVGNVLDTGADNILIGNDVTLDADDSRKLNIGNIIKGDMSTGDVSILNKLTVGAYTLPSTDGSANQVLKTDGSGTLTWQNDNSNVKRYIRVNATTDGSNYAMDGTKEVVLIDYTDPCEVTLPTVDGLSDGSVFEIQYYNWDITSITINVYPQGGNSEGIDDGYGISSVAPRIKLESNPQANTTTPLSLRIMWLASDNVWTVLQGGVFNY